MGAEREDHDFNNVFERVTPSLTDSERSNITSYLSALYDFVERRGCLPKGAQSLVPISQVQRENLATHVYSEGWLKRHKFKVWLHYDQQDALPLTVTYILRVEDHSAAQLKRNRSARKHNSIARLR